MNERIKELADEARIKFSSHWAHEGVDTAVITRRDLKEFAELIVRECIWALWTEECRTSDLASEEYTRGSNKIKEHFGVEE
jgi:hypothetical protein